MYFVVLNVIVKPGIVQPRQKAGERIRFDLSLSYKGHQLLSKLVNFLFLSLELERNRLFSLGQEIVLVVSDFFQHQAISWRKNDLHHVVSEGICYKLLV